MTELSILLIYSHSKNNRGIFYGKTEEGKLIKIIFDKELWSCLITENVNLDKYADFNSKYQEKQTSLKNLENQQLRKLIFKEQAEMSFFISHLLKNKEKVYESNISLDERILMDNFIFGEVKVLGNITQNKKHLEIKNPIIKPTHLNKKHLKIVSLDIETGVKDDTLYSIALHFYTNDNDRKICFMLADKTQKQNEELFFYKTEKELLKGFISFFNDEDPDVIIGWYVIDFDLNFLNKKCHDCFINFSISRENKNAIFSEKQGRVFVDIEGRIVLDALQFLRNSSYKFKSFKLDDVAQEVLKEGKLISGVEEEKTNEIDLLFKENKEKLAEYNIKDCILVSDIVKKLKVIEQLFSQVIISGVLPNKLGFNMVMMNHIFYPLIHNLGYSLPEKQSKSFLTKKGNSYSYKILGKFKNITVFSIENFKASIIAFFHINFWGFIKKQKDIISIDKGISFSKQANLFTNSFKKIFNLKTDKSEYLKKAKLSFFNNFFNALNNQNSPFFNNELLHSIEILEEVLLKKLYDIFTDSKYKIIFLNEKFIYLNVEKAEESLTNIINQFNKKIQDLYKCNFKLNLKIIKSYTKMIFPELNNDSLAYFAFSQDKSLIINSLSLSKRRTAPIVETFQKEFYMILLNDGDEIKFIEEFITKLEQKEFEDLLIIKRQVFKNNINLEQQSQPDYIKACLMLDEIPSTIKYYYSKTGVKPIEMKEDDIDYSYYKNLLAPIANPYLNLVNKSFKDISNGISSLF